jgi:alpha-tubulin suppressor-like RCC1 family protein
LKVWLAMLSVVAGCDAVFRLSKVGPPADAADAMVDAPIALGWKATASGFMHACGIRADDTLWCWGGNEAGEVGTGLPQGVVELPVRVGTRLFRTLSATHQHTCALATDSTLWCWGANDYGQLGVGTTQVGRIPQQIPGTWKHVATGGWQVCGIKTDDTLWCWGYNYWGELGLGSTAPTPVPAQVGTDTWLDIDPGWYQTCGIKSDESLWCWGENSYGAIGNGTTAPSTFPVPGPSGVWRRVDVGVHFACAIETSGHLRCWGNGSRGQLGTGSPGTAHTAQAVLVGGEDVDDWTELSVGHNTVCATRLDGSQWCWGESNRGQIGIPGVDTFTATPVQRTSPASTWRRVDTGVVQTCAIDVDNQLWCNGGSGHGQLASGATSHAVPVQMPGAINMLRLGSHMTCIVAANGQIACSGPNGNGELGDGTYEHRESLVAMAAGLTQVSVLAPGSGYTCAVSGANTLCWGHNANGQLGNGTTTSSMTPVVAHGALVKLAARNHTCGIDASSNVLCWGINNYGQIGNGVYTDQKTPQVIGAGETITVGAYHTCVTTTNASLSAYCWGRGVDGQLGNGAGATSPSSVAVYQAASGQLVKISAGGYHTCAISVTGSLWCWGQNFYGQLGTGDSAIRYVPTAVGSATWTSVAGGGSHTCGIQTNGSLWCWGKGGRGQLGIGTYVDRFIPTRVGADSDWLTVDAGENHTCATKAGGAFWCWGSNDVGELPDGTSWDATPVRVP